MRAGVIGSGGREHELMRQLALSEDIERVWGSPGVLAADIHPKMENIAANEDPVQAMLDRGIGFVAVGPEVPLAEGIADRFRERDIDVFGPGEDGAIAEASKIWTAMFNDGIGDEEPIPQPRWIDFDDSMSPASAVDMIEAEFGSVANTVIKADGLAAGKGALLIDDRQEALNEITAMLRGEKFGYAGRSIIVQERLEGPEEHPEGPEVSMTVLMDGKTFLILPFSQDHKRVGVGDTGKNGGGSGAYSDVPLDIFSEADKAASHKIAAQAAERFYSRGIDYRGVLYVGLMLTQDGPKVLEYNVRFGDPETQVVLPRLSYSGIDVAQLLISTARGELSMSQQELDKRMVGSAAITFAAMAEGYPDSPKKGQIIHGVRELMESDEVIFHTAGMALNEAGKFVTTGGRVGYVSVIGPDIDKVHATGLRHIAQPFGTAPEGEGLWFSGMQLRPDIAWQARRR